VSCGGRDLIDSTLRRGFHTLRLRAVSERPVRLEWHVDCQPFGAASSESSLSWPLVSGTHEIRVIEAGGTSAASRVTARVGPRLASDG